MSANIFQYGVGVAEDRAQPWNPYTRTLPAGAGAPLRRPGARRPGADVPLAAAGRGDRARSLTAARVTPLGVPARPPVTVAVISVPFTLMGLAIGYSLPSKAAIVVAQVDLLPARVRRRAALRAGRRARLHRDDRAVPAHPGRGRADVGGGRRLHRRAAGTDHARRLGGAARLAGRLGVPTGRGSPVQLTIRPFPPRTAVGRCHDAGRGPPWPPGREGSDVSTVPPGTPCWADLATPDLDAARRFYPELFGWTGRVDAGARGGWLHRLPARRPTGGRGRPAGRSPTRCRSGRRTSRPTTPTWSPAGSRRPAGRSGAPFDVFDRGRMAVFADPAGATFSVWQPTDDARRGGVQRPRRDELERAGHARTRRARRSSTSWCSAGSRTSSRSAG